MTVNDGHVPVADVDQVFPFFTGGTAAAPTASAPAAGGDQTAAVTAALRDVLSWRPRAQDTAAFTAALAASFTLHEVEGHVETRYVPRGFAMQADLGAVSGGQASLYSRARSALTQMTGLLDGLTPLRTDSDPEDCAAYRLLVRHGVQRLVDELGTPGGPREAVVQSAFAVLAGEEYQVGATADDVPGQLGALRARFGLVDANVNTVEEERVRTSFWTLVDLVLDLRRSWEAQRAAMYSQAGSGFLGTDLVVVSRLLAAAAEQVDELEAVLDSALVGASERQTLGLPGRPGLTLDGLLSWLRQFLVHDGPMYVRDSGRDGMRTAFAPTAEQLLRLVHDDLLVPVQGRSKQLQAVAGQVAHPLRLLPVGCGDALPSGMFATRTRIAAAGLCRLLHELFDRSSKIGRYPGVVLFEVEVRQISNVATERRAQAGGGSTDHVHVRITVRGANLRPTHLPVVVEDVTDTSTVVRRPLDNSGTVDGDTASGIFRMPLEVVRAWGAAAAQGVKTTPGVVLPASVVPVSLVDTETGRLATAPPTLTWPELAPPPPDEVSTAQDWSQVPDGIATLWNRP